MDKDPRFLGRRPFSRDTLKEVSKAACPGGSVSQGRLQRAMCATGYMSCSKLLVVGVGFGFLLRSPIPNL